MDKIKFTDRLEVRPFREIANSDKDKKVIGDSWANPFNARYNKMKDPYGSVEELCQFPEPTFESDDWYDNSFFRVVYLKGTNEIVGTCRYSKNKTLENGQVQWDFGFNILLKHWKKGYGREMLSGIIDKIKELDPNALIRGGADRENFGSFKAMVYNGFEYVGTDRMGDYEYFLDLTKPTKSIAERVKNWDMHLDMAKKDFGEEYYNKLNSINLEIGKLVDRIQNGENEELLTKEYFERLNGVVPFKFS